VPGRAGLMKSRESLQIDHLIPAPGGSLKLMIFLFHPPHLIIYLQNIPSLNRGTIMGKIHVLDNEISICTLNNEDYICITDIARYKDPDRTKLSYPELAAEQEYHRISGDMGASQQSDL
jgi:hypothetical protein